MKKVLLIVIDACASRVVEPAMENGQLPNFRALAEAGTFNASCISIFPSITHAATASIATGCYPQDHGIAGSHWYDAESDAPAYFSSDIWVILQRGLNHFFEDFAVRLNHQWLQADTIFRQVEQNGLQAACINHLIFRADKKHDVTTPAVLGLIPGIPLSEEIFGPSYLCMGDFVQTLPEITQQNLNAPSDMFHRFGFEDSYTAEVLLQLAKDNALPDFTLAYFPDNDYECHLAGPAKALPTLKLVDQRLGELFDIYGGIDGCLQQLCIVITGDHAQSDILADETEASIRLDELLQDFALSVPGQPWAEDDNVMICPNLRMAQIYFRQPTAELFEQVIAKVLEHPTIDQVLWQAEHTDKAAKGFVVAAAENKRLCFWPETEDNHMGLDQHGNFWGWQGDLAVVDGLVTADKMLSFGNYPNAFERIRGGLTCKTAGHLWLTSKPGAEFSIAETSIHTNGGSHGSLHLLDSAVPLIVAGKPDAVSVPNHPRIIDVAPFCMAVLDM